MIDVWLDEMFGGFITQLDLEVYKVAKEGGNNIYYWEEQFFKAYVDNKIGRLGINNPNYLLCRRYIENN